MNKLLVYVAVCTSMMAVVLFSSFKKSKSAGGISKQIIGSWKTVADGKDVDDNGKWDDAEHKAVATASAATTQFYADGSGTASGPFGDTIITIPFRWILQNDDHDIMLISTLFGVTDTGVQNIVSVTSKEFVMRDLSHKPVAYTAMKKL